MGINIISYEIDADKSFKATVNRALGAVDDLRIPFASIAKDFYRSEKAIFNLKGPGQYPDFVKSKVKLKKGGYKLLDKSLYKERKQRKYGFSYPLLKATGALEASVTGPDAPGSVLDIGKTSLFVGTSIEYANYHQSDLPRKKIPLRKFLFIGPESKEFASNKVITGRLERWNNIINNYILRKLGATSGQASGKE